MGGNEPERACELPRELPELKNLEDRLQCPICYDYLRNPVISITCSHNYCSLCIRKYLSLRTSCPVCFGELTEGSLRPNRCLDDIVSYFIPIKAYILGSTSKREKVNGGSPAAPSPTSSSIQEEPRLNKVIQSECVGSQNQAAKSCSPASSPGSQPLRNPPANGRNRPGVQKVSCPICSSLINESQINSHLDACLTRPQPEPPPTASGSSQTTPMKPTASVPERRKPLPKFIYTIMKEAELKRKLRDLGLSTSGDRATLVARHRSYTIMYNAECDAVSPRPVEELRAAFEQEEAERRRLQASTFGASARPAVAAAAAPATRPELNSKALEKIEEENRRYLQAHKAAFDALIAGLKARQKPPVKAETAEQSKDEEPNSSTSAEKSESAENDEDEIVILPTPVKVVEEVTLADSSDEAEQTRETDGLDHSTSTSSSEPRSCPSTSLSSTGGTERDKSALDSSAFSPSYSPPDSPTRRRYCHSDADSSALPVLSSSSSSSPAISSPSSSVISASSSSSSFNIPSPPSVPNESGDLCPSASSEEGSTVAHFNFTGSDFIASPYSASSATSDGGTGSLMSRKRPGRPQSSDSSDSNSSSCSKRSKTVLSPDEEVNKTGDHVSPVLATQPRRSLRNVGSTK